MAASNSPFCYLACAPSKTSNWMSTLSFMHSLGCNSFNRFFLRVPTSRLRAVLAHPELENAIVLRRSRQVVRQTISDRNGALQLGSFVVIAYRLNKPSRRIRKTVQRALQRAPYFKLCPSVYAFPQLRKTRSINRQTKNGSPSNRQRVVTPREFVEILTKFDARVLKLSRLVILDQLMEWDLIERMVSTRRTQCRKLAQACRSIISSTRLQRSEYFSIRAHKLKLSEVKYRYRAVRAVLGFFKKEMNIDMSDELVRASRAISSCHKALRRVEEIWASTAAKSAN